MAETFTLTHEWIARDLPALTVVRAGLPPETPLVLVLHGLRGRKESLLPGLYEFARRGFRAVALDAWMHGERPEAAARETRMQVDELAAMTEMIVRTAQDVPRLLDHFGSARAAIHGISLGGYTAFAALLSEPRLSAASIAMGSPDWVGPLRRFGLGPGHPVFDQAAASNPLDFLPRLLPPCPLLLLHGALDEVVPPDGTIALEERLRPLYASTPDRLELRLYPSLGHHYTDDMMMRTADWFERFLRS